MLEAMERLVRSIGTTRRRNNRDRESRYHAGDGGVYAATIVSDPAFAGMPILRKPLTLGELELGIASLT